MLYHHVNYQYPRQHSCELACMASCLLITRCHCTPDSFIAFSNLELSCLVLWYSLFTENRSRERGAAPMADAMAPTSDYLLKVSNADSYLIRCGRTRPERGRRLLHNIHSHQHRLGGVGDFVGCYETGAEPLSGRV